MLTLKLNAVEAEVLRYALQDQYEKHVGALHPAQWAYEYYAPIIERERTTMTTCVEARARLLAELGRTNVTLEEPPPPAARRQRGLTGRPIKTDEQVAQVAIDAQQNGNAVAIWKFDKRVSLQPHLGGPIARVGETYIDVEIPQSRETVRIQVADIYDIEEETP